MNVILDSSSINSFIIIRKYPLLTIESIISQLAVVNPFFLGWGGKQMIYNQMIYNLENTDKEMGKDTTQ